MCPVAVLLLLPCIRQQHFKRGYGEGPEAAKHCRPFCVWRKALRPCVTLQTRCQASSNGGCMQGAYMLSGAYGLGLRGAESRAGPRRSRAGGGAAGTPHWVLALLPRRRVGAGREGCSYVG